MKRPEDLDEPITKDEQKEKERCTRCLDYFDYEELYYVSAHPNSLTPKVCSFCLNDLHNHL